MLSFILSFSKTPKFLSTKYLLVASLNLMKFSFAEVISVEPMKSIKYLETSSDDIVYLNEDGSKEVWKDTTREKVLSDARNDYKECLEALNRIDAQLKSLNE